MRRIPGLRFSFALFVAAAAASLGAQLVACGGDDSSPASPDASTDAAPDVTNPQPDVYVPPQDDAGPTIHCTLDPGNDPVGFCVQKLVLGTEHESAFAPDAGVAAAWDTTTFSPRKDDAGAIVHDFHDDAAYGATLARYVVSAQIYGDTELTRTAIDDLVAVGGLLARELPAAPAEYGGDLYFDLRAVAVGLREVNAPDVATKVDAIADAYGRALYGTYFHVIGAPPPSDAGGGDAGDAAATDAGDAAPPPTPVGDAVLGVPQGAAFAYDVAPAVTGAYALVDMAIAHAGDDATNAKKWQAAARAVIDHLYARARHASGLYYSHLVTSPDPDHDALAASPPPNDLLETDVQGAVAFVYTRIHHRYEQTAAALPAFADTSLQDRTASLFDALNGSPSLWDKAPLPTADAGSGYFAGVVASTQAVVTDKPTRGNALLFGALHRAYVAWGSPYGAQLRVLRTLLTARSPQGASLLAAVPGQSSFLAATTSDFKAPDDGGAPYRAAANHVACEALDDQWLGEPHAPAGF